MPAGLDVARLRADAPGCEAIIHLGNAGAAFVPTPAVRAEIDFLGEESRLGGYDAARECQDDFDRYRSSIATLVGARSEQIAFTPSGTTGWQLILGALNLTAGDRVLVTAPEYAATVLPLLQLRDRVGINVDPLPTGADGAVDTGTIGQLGGDDVRAVVVAHAASHVGLVNDVDAIGVELRTRMPEALFIVDACQSAGQVPVDVAQMGCDALFTTGRKWLRGPRGSGFLFAGDRMQRLDPFPMDASTGVWDADLAYHAAGGIGRFEQYEQSWAAQAGLGTSVEYLLELGPRLVFDRIDQLARRLRTALGALPGVSIHDRGSRSGGIVSFSHALVPAEAIWAAAWDRGIVVGTTGPATARFDHTFGIRQAVRAAPHAYNDWDDLQALVDLVASLTERS